MMNYRYPWLARGPWRQRRIFGVGNERTAVSTMGCFVDVLVCSGAELARVEKLGCGKARVGGGRLVPFLQCGGEGSSAGKNHSELDRGAGRERTRWNTAQPSGDGDDEDDGERKRACGGGGKGQASTQAGQQAKQQSGAVTKQSNTNGRVASPSGQAGPWPADSAGGASG